MTGRSVRGTSATENLQRHPFLIALLAIIGLIFLSVITPADKELFGIRIKEVDLMTDFRPVKNTPLKDNAATARTKPRVKVSSGVVGEATRATDPQDAIREDADTVRPAFQSGFLTDYGNASHEGLGSFYRALKTGDQKSGKVRIAYYGDSSIEGDMISMDLRELLQNDFGGKGPGFVSIAPVDASSRINPRHSHSRDWKISVLTNGKNVDQSFGISAAVFTPKNGSWVKYEAPSGTTWSDVALYYGDAGGTASLKYSVDGESERSARLQPGAGVRELRLPVSPAPGESGAGAIRISAAGDLKLYGVSLETGNGVYVDNFALRGNSGLGLANLSEEMLRGFGNYLSYRLVVIQFGINVAEKGRTDFDWYERGLIKVIERFKEAYPESSILVVSVGDRGTRGAGGIGTDVCIPILVEAQRSAAVKTHSAFFDLYHAMGGKNSMPVWVSQGMASRDYIHFTRGGGKKVAGSLYSSLMEGFRNFDAQADNYRTNDLPGTGHARRSGQTPG